MKTIFLLCIALLHIIVFSTTSYAQEAASDKINDLSDRFVQVKASHSNVYEELDPKADIIKRVKKGDLLELVSEGTAWIRVRADDKIGWLEKKNVRFFCLCSTED